MKNRMLLLLLVPALLACSLFFLGCGASSSSGGHGSNPFVADVYVSVGGNDTTGDGSLSKPFRTIQKGLYAATTGEVVGVLAGVYTEEVVWCPTWEFVTLRGVSNSTAILNGAVGGMTCIDITNVGALPQTITIESMTITGGSVSGGLCAGISLLANNIGLHLKDARVTNNSSGTSGGLYIASGGDIVWVDNCTFASNKATDLDGGGGIDQAGGSLFITGSTFQYNTGDYGGGIRSTGTLILATSNLSYNSAVSHGGGLCIYGGAPYVVGCTFQGNDCTGNSGGAIYNTGVTGTIEVCVIIANNAHNGGGGLFVDSTSGVKTFVKQCLITNNTSDNGSGAGIFTYGDIKIEQCYIVLNTAEAHGGGYGSGNTALQGEIVNSLIALNHAASGGGGLYFESGGGGSLEVMNCTVYGNTTPVNGSAIEVNTNGDGVSVANSIISGNTGINEIYCTGTPFHMSYDCFVPGNVMGGSGYWNTANTSEAPSFVLAPVNLRLANNCPHSITRGATFEGAPDDDLDGNPRPGSDAYYSMGAYETNN